MAHWNRFLVSYKSIKLKLRVFSSTCTVALVASNVKRIANLIGHLFSSITEGQLKKSDSINPSK